MHTEYTGMTIRNFEVYHNYKPTNTETEYTGGTIKESEIYYKYVQKNTDYTGDTIEDLYDQALGSAMKCQEQCEKDERCSFWTYFHPNYKGDEGANMCYLKEAKVIWKNERNATSGPKLCGK